MPDWKPEIRQLLAKLDLAPTREASIIEEISQDLDACYEELLAGGATEAMARQQTLAELSESEALRQELRRLERRAPQDSFILENNRRGKMIADLWQDLRFGARMLWKKPGFTIVAALTLALGVGANTAIFSMINSVLIESLPYPNASQLVQIFESTPTYPRNSVSGGAFKDWRDHNSKFSRLAIYEGVELNLTGDGAPARVSGLKASAGFLSVLGVIPIVGRDFAPGEDAVGGNNQVVLLSHRFWQSRYGGDARVIGKTVSLDQKPYTIIGALPPKALLQDEALFVIPDVIDAAGVNWSRSGHFRQVIGRLSPGASSLEAETELRGIKQRLGSEYPSFKKDWGVNVIPMQEVYAGDARPTLRILLGAAVLVLLIACANVANLLLVRGNTRAREMAIRVALGARSWRIFRQMLVESLLLALMGCAGGILLAVFGVKLLTGMFDDMLPQVMRPTLNINVLSFSILLACGCGLLFGILPAMRASKPNLNLDLKESDRGSLSTSKRRSQSLLVVSEFAFTLALLVGAGLFLRSFISLLKTDPGFNPKQTLAFDLSFPRTKYPAAKDRLRFVKDLNGRIAALPGVESVGAISSLPLSNNGVSEFAGRADRPPRTDYVVGCDFVSGDYFSAMGLKLLRGRALTEADNIATAPRVLVIDASVARDLYPGEDPIGRSLDFIGAKWEIVGVVAPVRHEALDQARPRVYGTQAQVLDSTSVVLRSSSPPLALTEAVRKTVLELDPDQPIANVRTIEQDVYNSLALRRTTLSLVGLFALVAISLACVGIYGVMSYSISQRARELGIRIALGASRREIIQLVLKGGMKPATAGIAVGLAASYALSNLVEKLLFEVKTHDPLVFISSVCLLGTVAALSVYIPARRAARLDPMAVLRSE